MDDILEIIDPQEVLEVETKGEQGKPGRDGDPGPPGPIAGSTDAVPEGSENLYHTTARAAAAAPVQSVAGKTGAVTLAKTDVGLSDVDNTADSAKPVSIATATALAGKADLVDGKVPTSQLPATVEEVLEFETISALPAVGLRSVIYTVLDTNKAYRWGGTNYTEISPSPGSTDAVPEGSANHYHTPARAAAAAPVQSVAGRTGDVVLAKADVGLSAVENTADADKPVSTAQAAAIAAKADAAATATALAGKAPTSLVGSPVEVGFFASDLTTAITAGTAKITLPFPIAINVTEWRVNLNTAQASGNIFTVDINKDGVSVLSTKLTIDNTEKTSVTAATPAVIETAAIAAGSEVSVDVDQIGTSGAKGLFVTAIGTRA